MKRNYFYHMREVNQVAGYPHKLLIPSSNLTEIKEKREFPH